MTSDAVQQARDWLIQQTGHEPPEPSGPAGSGEYTGTMGTREFNRHREVPGSSTTGSSITGSGAAEDTRDDRDDARSRAETRSGTANSTGRRGSRDEDPDADPEAVARSVLVRKLAAQDRTRRELATALAAKNVPKEVADGVLDHFEEIGLVDDESFARRWVESRQARRHRSRTMLRRELTNKGVARDVVDEALSEVSAEDEFAAARAYADKVTAGMAGLDPDVRRRRLGGRLARRGFGGEIISRILKDFGNDGI